MTEQPARERARLHVLNRYKILDTLSDQAFDSLTQLASTICEAPISLISLVDDKRQWFKSNVGLAATETPREFAFCAHAIQQDDLLIVEDAQADARFAHNPLVNGEPFVRFYAGAPLIMKGGFALGTLCVIDHTPRQLSDKQRTALNTLRDAVVTLIELRHAQQDLNAIEKILPMCAWCHAIRSPNGEWSSLHDYIMQAVPITHGICPPCTAEFEKT
jgi:GAF domain-containing protein